MFINDSPDSKVRGANMGPIWSRQDPGGSHVGPINFAIYVYWFKNNSLEANPTVFQSMPLKNKKAIADDFGIIVNDTTLNLTDDINIWQPVKL